MTRSSPRPCRPSNGGLCLGAVGEDYRSGTCRVRAEDRASGIASDPSEAKGKAKENAARIGSDDAVVEDAEAPPPRLCRSTPAPRATPCRLHSPLTSRYRPHPHPAHHRPRTPHPTPPRVTRAHRTPRRRPPTRTRSRTTPRIPSPPACPRRRSRSMRWSTAQLRRLNGSFWSSVARGPGGGVWEGVLLVGLWLPGVGAVRGLGVMRRLVRGSRGGRVKVF
ncbi:hypothetical protein JB92DRAFT_414508 [Gautieria morchelliformis]|nr:hypothetical protein JB92DRAFT_414508 [Gautieria morchelliformis]